MGAQNLKLPKLYFRSGKVFAGRLNQDRIRFRLLANLVGGNQGYQVDFDQGIFGQAGDFYGGAGGRLGAACC